MQPTHPFKRITTGGFLDAVQGARRSFHDQYLAMYSTVWSGIVTDPMLMLIPVDDHLVHRGDGVFETVKCVRGGIYNLSAHMERLANSASCLDLALPLSPDDLEAAVVETVRAGGEPFCRISLFVSRGPGSLGVSPYDCPETQFYCVVARLGPAFMTAHPEGARVATSSIPVKPAFFASMKNCNYLPNVLMKKEAVDKGVDFVMSFDERGCLAEGATENMGIVTPEGELRFPRLGGILRGTTMMRVVDLAAQLVADGALASVRFADILRGDIARATECLIAGTTTDVTAVREYDGAAVGGGVPGPVQARLSRLLLDDIQGNPDRRTEVFSLPR